MKRKLTYGAILFSLLMLFLFLPILQKRLQLIPVKPLTGVTAKTKEPEFSFAAYRSGNYAKQREAYLGETFGFREPIIRLYNQYLWSCYHKTYAHDVVAGKKGWLYNPESVNDYYGMEMLRWHTSPEAAREAFDREINYMNRVRNILKENDVELLSFIAPEKSFLYPEYLPNREKDTTTFNACAYFLDKFEENDFPCIDMTRWFQQMKDTVDYPLIPQTGAHWVFPAVIAADSLFRFMGALKGIEMPRLCIGKLHESPDHGADNDLERLLNLALPIWHRYGFSPTAEITTESDSAAVRPKVLFIGNSFMWGITNQVPMQEVFDEVEFWYYFSTAYSGEHLEKTTPVVDLNLLEKLLDFDYIVWFTTGNQLNKGINGFAQSAILTLGVDDSIRQKYIRHIADTLTLAANDTIRRQEAISILYSHPELIPELDGDSLITQNSEIPYAKIIKDIKKDSLWMEAMETQAFLRTAMLPTILHAEADRIMEGKPLYRDQQAELQFGQQCLKEVKALMEKMRKNEEAMERVMTFADEKHISVEASLEISAQWIIRHKYHLEGCRLTDDPDIPIPLPSTQSN